MNNFWSFFLILIIFFNFFILSSSNLIAEDFDWENYKDQIEKKLEKKPDDLVLNFELTVALSNLGKIKDSYDIIDSYNQISRKEFNKTIQPHIKKLKKENPEEKVFIWNQIAFSSLILKDYNKAINNFNKIIEKQPENIWIRNYLAFTYIEYGKSEKAEKIAKNTLNIKENEFSHLLLGAIYYNRGKYIQSMVEFKQSGNLFKSLLKYF